MSFDFDQHSNLHAKRLALLEHQLREYDLKVLPRKLERAKHDVLRSLQHLSAVHQNLYKINGTMQALQADPRLNKVLNDFEAAGADIKRLEAIEAYLVDAIKIESARERLMQCRDDGNIDEGIGAFSVLSATPFSCASLTARAQTIHQEFYSAFHDQLFQRLQDALQTCKWPAPIPPEMWDEAVVAELVQAGQNWIKFNGGQVEGLMKVLVEPIRIRFAFHFESDRPTNRIDRPEWYLSHLKSVISEHAEFFASFLDHLIPAERSLLDVFITELVELARSKLLSTKSAVSQDSLLLSHTLEKAIGFHQELWDAYGFDDGQTCVVAFTHDPACLDAWITGESEALTKEFKALAESLPFWSTDSIPIDPFISEVTALFNSTTDLYAGVEEDSVKVRLFLDLQIPLLESFYKTMEYGLPTFHSSPEDLFQSIAIANSCEAFVKIIREDWSQNLVFIEMAMSPTFKSLKPQSNGLFEKILEAFGGLLGSSIHSLYAYVWDRFIAHALPYARAMHYGVTMARDQHDVPVHPEFNRSIFALSIAIDELRSGHLLASSVKKIEEMLVEGLADFYFNKVVLKNFFHAKGAAAFSRDTHAFTAQLASILALVSEAKIRLAFRKTVESLVLLQLPHQKNASQDFGAADLEGALHQNNFSQVAAIFKGLGISHLSIVECTEVLKLRK